MKPIEAITNGAVKSIVSIFSFKMTQFQALNKTQKQVENNKQHRVSIHLYSAECLTAKDLLSKNF